MSVLEWTPELETGVFEIDLQHRSLVAIANQLHDAIRAGRAGRTVEWMLEELALYTRFHFETEEAYMRRYGLDNQERHRVEHGELLSAIKRFRRKLKAGDDRVQDDVLEFLSRWLDQHLRGADRQFGAEVLAAMNRPPGKRRAKKKATG
jgi:hemerythrin